MDTQATGPLIVTAVCSAANLDIVRKLGAIEVIDDQVHDLTQLPGRFDIVADTMRSLSFVTAQPILFDGGAIPGHRRLMRPILWVRPCSIRKSSVRYTVGGVVLLRSCLIFERRS